MAFQRCIIAGFMTLVLAGVSTAQDKPKPGASSSAANQNCTPTDPRPDQGTVSPRDGSAAKSGAFGDKLARSDGVLCPPPNVDSEMHKRAPDIGNTPVIPPPGAPGGDPNIRPK
jgi:hypothetical protein